MDDEILPDLGLRYLEAGRGDATFTFTRFVPSMIARVEPDLYTTMATLTMEEAYAVSVDFDAQRFKSLLGLLPPRARANLQQVFSQPFDGPEQVELPAGAVVVGVRARLGEPQTNGDETYVPFVVTEFLAPTTSTSISIK